MTFRQYIALARQHWVLITALTATGLVIGALLGILSPKQYQASTTIYIAAQQSQSDSLSGAYQGSLLSAQLVGSYAQLASSDRITQSVVSQLQLDETPQNLAQRISAVAKPDTVLLTLSVTDFEPVTAARITDSVAGNFVQLVAELEQPADRARQPTVIAKIVEPASIPVTPVAPNVVGYTVAGLLCGGLVGLVAAAIWSASDTSIRDSEALAELTGLPVIGTFPRAPELASTPLLASERPDSLFSEGARKVRTNLTYINVDLPSQTLMVTSAKPGEGKTTTVANLAIALADSGQRVLLIDSDLRKPQVAKMFQTEPSVGLTSILSGRLSEDQAIFNWNRSRLDVLSSGPIPPNPSELLASQQFVDLLQRLRQRYDRILLDAAPLLPVTDSAAIAPNVDGTLFIVKAKGSARKDVTAALDSLRVVRANVLGGILSWDGDAASSYAYYYGQLPGSNALESMDSDMTAPARLQHDRRDAAQERPRPTPRP